MLMPWMITAVQVGCVCGHSALLVHTSYELPLQALALLHEAPPFTIHVGGHTLGCATLPAMQQEPFGQSAFAVHVHVGKLLQSAELATHDVDWAQHSGVFVPTH